MQYLGKAGDTAQEQIFEGRPVSRGIAFGRAVCLFGENRQFYRTEIAESSIGSEVTRFNTAHERACRRLRRMGRSAERHNSEIASIFDVHLAMLEDSTLKDKITDVIGQERVNAEWAVKVVTDEYIARYRALPDQHFRDRYIDIEDIADQLQNALGGGRHPIRLASDSVIAARELRPSTLSEFSVRHPKAVITESGGWTSHTFILARELGIPAVTGIRKLMRRIKPGDLLIVDGYKGRVIANPSAETLAGFNERRVTDPVSDEASDELPSGPIRTLDGRDILIRANFDIPAGYQKAKLLGARGIGLYRSEYLFNRFKGFPTEAEQVKAYREIATNAGEDRARIRTFDIGIDQTLDGGGRKEKNPALGLRGIRLAKSYPKQLRTQLRALLQASHESNIDIILPMVSGVDEIRFVREVLEQEKHALCGKGVPCGDPGLGAMIEVPSAVFNIDAILREVDCICLGTNDLVQYLLAVDRDNESVAGWFRTLHPGVFAAIRTVIEASNAVGKPVVVCGEMAGSAYYSPILVGLGATELSMNVNAILGVRRVIGGIAYDEARKLVDSIGRMTSADEIEREVDHFVETHWSHLLAGNRLLGRPARV
jgi:phosphoenolpyruvate-protein phosphotransferase (PTS system enzyme I)